MNDTLKIKMLAAALVALLAITTAAWLVTAVRVERAESRLAKSAATSAKTEREAEAHKIAAAEYRQQIASLESQLAEIRSTTVKQDEKLKTTTAITRNARNDLERIRRPGPNPNSADANVDAGTVCERLKSLGHPC